MAGIYLHIPFCKQACHYCDFHFSTQVDRKRELLQSMLKELRLQQQYLSEPIETIYFGGGTPSLLAVEEIRLIVNEIAKLFTVSDNAEITLEANPDDLTATKLLSLRSEGINRLSIGIQSFDEEILKFLNRAHNADEARKAITLCQRAGFDNISLDLIYAIPGQSLQRWEKNIEQALEHTPQHISSYSLTIEEKTVFGKWSRSGKLHPLPDDDAAIQLDLLIEKLDRHGFYQYEVSNFALPGFESCHNTSYWKGTKYLGIGPSAHSYDSQSRQYNISNNHLYIRSLAENKIPFTREILTRQDHVNEYLLTTLRTAWGADLDKLKNEWQYDLLQENDRYIAKLLDQRLSEISNQHLVLTRRGKLLADKIASDLFLEPAEHS